MRTDPGNPVVLAHQTWLQMFGGNSSALGHTIELSGRRCTVVGVLMPTFTGLGGLPRDVFVPVAPGWTTPARATASETRETEFFVRLQPGVSAAAAGSALMPLMNRIVQAREALRVEIRPSASPNPLSVEMLAAVAPVLAAFALVLVTACANVSNVMLARGIARQREIAVRLSIGASRGRIVRQLLTEGLLISLLAGLAGLGLAAWGLRAATAALFGTLPPSVVAILRLMPMPIDWRVFTFAFASSAAATVVFAMLPALQASRLSLTGAMRSDGGTSVRGSGLRNALVTAQVGVAVVLVIVAATLARNGAAIGAIDLGFETDGVLSVNVRGDQDDLARPLSKVLAADPRVADIAVTSGNPLFNQVRIVTASPAEYAQSTRTRATFVSPRFFPLLRIPIVRGRGFRGDEAQSSARVTIISEGMAAALWPGENPIGKTIVLGKAEGASDAALPEYPSVTVVGTVHDIVGGLVVMGRDTSHIYLPMAHDNAHATAILVRGRAPRDLRPEAIQEIFRRVVPDPQVFEALPLNEVRDLQTYPLLAASWIGALLGAVALILSITGLYGVLTYTLSQRKKEIGIRMALGATARAVVALVLGQSMRLTAIGAAIGVIVTLGVMRTLAAVIRLRAISLVDIGPFAAGVVMIAAAAALAAYQPARRAATVDPAEMLRTDG